MRRSAITPSRPRRAFTLMEAMVAIVIFGAVLGVMMSTLFTATRAWRIGQASSELYQTARITHEVLMRDIHNMFYLSETEYNRNFLKGVQTLSNALSETVPINRENDSSSKRTRRVGFNRRNDIDEDVLFSSLSGEDLLRNLDDAEANGLPITLDALAPAINLSFKGSNDGECDKLVFTRRYIPRWYESAGGWGLRRVTYEVRDGVLFRIEEDPFGFDPSQWKIDKMYDSNPISGDMALLFADESNIKSLGINNYDRLPVSRDELPPPVEIKSEEPICADVVAFNLTYGFFRQGEWMEADAWDSLGHNHRDPPVNEDTFPEIFEMLLDQNLTADEESEIDPYEQLYNEQQDDYVYNKLPAYIAVRLGLRPGGEGRVISYTFFVSIDLAEEFDRLGEIEQMFGDEYGRRSSRNRERRTRR